MTDQKTRQRDLPPHLQYKHGSYHYVIRQGGKVVWTQLSKDRDVAMRLWWELEQDNGIFHEESSFDPDVWLRALFVTARNAAKRRGIPFALTETEIKTLFSHSKGRCAVTGIRFDYVTKVGNRRPWVPSLDRTDSRLGYFFQNCRFVCAAVNVALNEWGTPVFEKMARSFVANAPPEVLAADADITLTAEELRTQAAEAALRNLKKSRIAKKIVTSPLGDRYWAKRLSVSAGTIRQLRDFYAEQNSPTSAAESAEISTDSVEADQRSQKEERNCDDG